MRDELETRTDCNIDPSSPLDHCSISFSFWLGLLNRGPLRVQSPQSASWFSHWHPVSDWLEPSGHLVILLSKVNLLPLFFHLFTQVHLLIDDSIEGQYITWMEKEVIPDSAAPKSNFLFLNYYWTLSVNSGTELWRHEKLKPADGFRHSFLELPVKILNRLKLPKK